MNTKKNIHHIIPVSRNGRKCEDNEIIMSQNWHQKIHSVFGVMATHEKILYLLDFYNQKVNYRDFIKEIETQVENGNFYLGNCFGREIKGDCLKREAIIRDLEDPKIIFHKLEIKKVIFQILNWDIKVLNEDSLHELCGILS